MLDVSRTPPSIALRSLQADVWGVSEGWIDTVQMPICVTKVALQHLALAATRHATLNAQNGLVAIKYFYVVRPLIAVAAAFCPVPC